MEKTNSIHSSGSVLRERQGESSSRSNGLWTLWHGPSGIFGHRVSYKRPQKARKKAAMIRVKRERRRREEENGPRMHRMVPKHSSSVIGNRSILTGWKRGKQERFLLHHDSMIRLFSKIYTRVFGFIEKLPSFEREIVIGLNLDGKDTKRHDEFHTFN